MIEAVDRTLEKYSSDNVEIVVNEMTGLFDVIYNFPVRENQRI